LNGFAFLKDGKPLAAGESLAPRDLFERAGEADLFTLAVSLRVPLRPEEAHAGPWWGKQKAALGISRLSGDDVQFGYVVLSVSASGELTVHRARLQRIEPARVEFQAE
jgi:hypothetical protein